jgi:hypothetical protein
LHGGVELLAWAKGPLEMNRGPIRCSPRIVSREKGRLRLHPGPTAIDRVDIDRVPDGFVRPDPAARDELLHLVTNGGSVHWLTANKEGALCREWRFERARTSPAASGATGALLEGRVTRVEAATIDGVRLFPSFGYGYRTGAPAERREISLGGPHWLERAGGGKRDGDTRGGATCVARYAFIGITAGALRMLPGSAPGEDTVAWHPDDEEHWFANRQACLTAAERATLSMRRDPEGQPSGGVHMDCLDED